MSDPSDRGEEPLEAYRTRERDVAVAALVAPGRMRPRMARISSSFPLALVAFGALCAGVAPAITGCASSDRGQAPVASSSAPHVATAPASAPSSPPSSPPSNPPSSAASATTSPAPTAAPEKPDAGPAPMITGDEPDAGPPDPVAQRFCDAVIFLPQDRRAECCAAPSQTAKKLADQCAHKLSAALTRHAVTLMATDVDWCLAAEKKATRGCDWVTPRPEAVPAACVGIIRPGLKESDPCESSLECPKGMHCNGLTTVNFGHCGKAEPARSACNLTSDNLGTYTRQGEELARWHPTCDGRCVKRRCAPAIAPGEACSADADCGIGRCLGGKCTNALPPALGAPCVDACAVGSGCVHGTCVAKKPEGASCEVDAECHGDCVHVNGAATGTCIKSCGITRR